MNIPAFPPSHKSGWLSFVTSDRSDRKFGQKPIQIIMMVILGWACPSLDESWCGWPSFATSDHYDGISGHEPIQIVMMVILGRSPSVSG